MPYRWGSVEGRVLVETGLNDDPAALGCPEIARGFPYLSATLEAAGIGYQHLAGWLQLIDQGEGRGFEIDQYPPIADVAHPFCFFGHSPAFFDLPHDDETENWDFLAHTFLCGLGGELLEFRREACAILGFSWGFSKRGSRIEGFGPDPLAPPDWDAHREYLTTRYGGAGWTFAPGFVQDPRRR